MVPVNEYFQNRSSGGTRPGQGLGLKKSAPTEMVLHKRKYISNWGEVITSLMYKYRLDFSNTRTNNGLCRSNYGMNFLFTLKIFF